MKKYLFSILSLLTLLVLLFFWWQHNASTPYYASGLALEGGIYKLKKILHSTYQPVKSTNNTGILRVYFQVSEKGVIKNLRNEQYSLNYKKTVLNENMVSQLVKIVKNLKDWSKIKCEWSPCYSFKFYSFKIIDGEVQEILPK